MKALLVLAVSLWLSFSAVAQNSSDGAVVLALDNSWNRALETNDIKALNLLLADSFVSVDIDGSLQNKGELLASLKATGYAAPSQSVTEQSKVDVYGDSAVVVGIYHTRGTDKGKPFHHRERFVDTWARVNNAWKCVASVAVLVPSK